MNKKQTIAAAMAFIGVFSMLQGCTAKPVETQKDTAVAVETAQADRRDISSKMSFSGKLFAESDVAAVPSVPGKVTDVFVKVGDKLNRDDKLFIINAEDIMRQYKPAKTNYDRTKAVGDEALAKGKKDIEDLEALFIVGAVSKSQVDSAKLALKQQEAQLLGQLDQIKLSLDQLQSSLDDLTVRAPIGGVVTAVNITRDGMASNAQPAVVISNTQSISLKFDISESVFGSVNTGMGVQYSIPSLGIKDQSGEIHSISPTASEMTKLFTAEMLLDNAKGKLIPGLFADVSIVTGHSAGAVVIPAAAIVNISGEKSVYIVKDSVAVRVKIETGISSGENIEIKSGLSGGESVIVKGQSYVEDGGKVRVVGGNT